MSTNSLVNRRTDLLRQAVAVNRPPAHLVQFYEDDSFLICALHVFVEAGLKRGDGVLILGTKAHADALHQALEASGHDARKLQQDGQLRFVDARPISELCAPKGEFDPTRTRAYLESLILEVRGHYPRLRVFGEIVSLLCTRGNIQAALRLEHLWNELIHRHGLTVLCGYSHHDFGTSGEQFQDVCRSHSHVLPSEEIFETGDTDTQLREVAYLQQQARRLKLELGRRKQVEAALRHSLREQQRTADLYQSLEALNLAIVDNSLDCIKVLDLDANLLFISRHGLKMMEGCQPPQLGSNWLDYWPDDYRQEVIRAIKAAKSGQRGEFIGFLDMGHNKASRWWHVILSPICDSNGEVQKLLAISRDITELKKIEEQLRSSIRSRDEFLSIASHELKTPVTSLQMRLEMTKRFLDQTQHVLPDKLEKMMEVCCKQVQRLTSLINDMLDVSRVQSGFLQLNLAWFDLSRLTQDVCESFQDQLLHAGCTLDLDAGDEVVGLWDQNRIEQVLTNLITNAIKYAAGSPICVLVEGTDREVSIKVKDSGPGIPQKRLSTIFDCFERATSSRSIGGLGLGLYIAKQIVQAHQGDVEVESREGVGTCFTVTLPLASDGGQEPWPRSAKIAASESCP